MDTLSPPVNPWREELTARRWSIERLAAECGYSLGHVGLAIREPRLASRALARRINRVLALEPDEGGP